MKRLTLGLLATLVAAVLPAEAARPYEMERAGRTADEFPPVARMESADGWRVTGEHVTATIATDDAKPLFGPASIRLDYRGEGTNAVIRLTPPEPIAVSEDSDTATLWVYGNNIFGNSGYDSPVTKVPLTEIVACYADDGGAVFRKTLGFVYHRDWHLFVGVAKVPRGMRFTGFELKGPFDAEMRTLWLTSLCVFRDPQRPINPKPRAKRAVQVFPDAPQGVNVGADTLPFPTRRETVIPPAVELPRKLEFGFPEDPADWNGLRFRYGGSDWIDLAAGGGVFPRQLPEGAKVTFRQIGNSLVCDVTSPKPGIERIRFGAAKLPAGSELVTWPFYTYGYYNSYWEPTIPENYTRYTRPKVARTEVGGRTLFIGATFDWTQSNASGPIFDKDPPPDFTLSTGVEYGPKTDGTRNGCFERFVWTFSEDVTDVLPAIPNPVSPYRRETGSSSWASYESSADRAKDIAYLRAVKAAGIAHVTLVDHERMWRDGNESFTFRTETAPGKGGDAAHAAYTRQVIDGLGFRYGPYNNYTDYAPINAYWTLDGVGRFASGQLQPGWNRCYAPKPTFAVEMNEVIPPAVQRKFGFNTAYCDVHTATTPWTHTDFDARVPGAGTFAQAYYCYGEIMLLQKKAWGGPVYSEGGCHWLYCGLVDGNYGQDGKYGFWENPWLVDFDLRRLHPLCNSFGMGNTGMFYGAREGKLRKEDPQTWIDRFTAATLAFGHPGFLILDRRHPENLDVVRESYFPVQAIAARYCVANAKEILYAAADGTLHPVSAALANGAARRSQLKVTYDDGTVVAVNGNLSESFTVEVGGVSYVLPPNGWRAETVDRSVVSFNGLEDGRRVKYAKSPEYDWKK